MMKKSNKKGFTLVELIVVIAIMAILAAVLVPTVTNKIKDANAASQATTAENIAKTISLYLAEEATPTVAGLKTALTNAGYVVADGTAPVSLTVSSNDTTYSLTCTADAGDTKGKTVITYKDAKNVDQTSTVMGGIGA